MIPYPYRTILEERETARPQAATPTASFLQLIYGIDMLFDSTPSIHQRDGEGSLALLYHDVTFPWRELTEPFAPLIAHIAASWPLTLFGTTDDRETVELTVVWEAGDRVTRLRSVSGQPVDRLNGLCIVLELGDQVAAGHLRELCACISPCTQGLCVSRRHEGFLAGCEMAAPRLGSMFLYLTWGDTDIAGLLETLTVVHKELLWRTFLADGVQTAEFQWLWDSYRSGSVARLLEWQMTLQFVLDELGFSIRRQQSDFCVVDGAGNVRRFDLIRGGPAEKIFLKILFPLDAK